jgi:subtilisin family serine protease
MSSIQPPQSLRPAGAPILQPSLAEQAAKSGKVDAIVFFDQVAKPGLAPAMSALDAAEAMPLGPERKAVTFNALTQLGQATVDTHKPLLDSLLRQGKIAGMDALLTFNAVRVRGASTDALQQLASSGAWQVVADDVVAVPQLPAPANDSISAVSMIPLGKAQPSGLIPGDPVEDPNAIYMDWGVKKMDAPAAWQQGITGAGIVVASLDTGVITDHSGLKANYRGTRPDGTQDHNHNLLNVVEKDGQYPIDDVGHGTHTLGSVVGNDAKHLVGVAPDAKFIAVRGLGAAGGNMFSLMSAMEWMLAPTDLTGKNPRPDLAPDIITNSWGGAPVSQPFLWQALRNWRRAGIIPIFASGNNRNAQPGEVAAPGMYGDTITVGASEPDDSRAFFSMYGPSNFSRDRKPEIVAPGTWTYSTYPDGTFRDTFIVEGKRYPASGTSMATPHVAGAVALYMQAHPGATYDQILAALKQSGTRANNPNDEIGFGRVQVDKLITPDTISPKAQRTDASRVKQLMDQVKAAVVYSSRPPQEQPAQQPEPAKAPALA